MLETMHMQKLSVLYFWKEFGAESDPRLIRGARSAAAGWPAVTGECECKFHTCSHFIEHMQKKLSCAQGDIQKLHIT